MSRMGTPSLRGNSFHNDSVKSKILEKPLTPKITKENAYD
jgi:hypothetical protein